MGKGCLRSRPRGPAPKISPARKGWVHSQAVERRRRETKLFVCLFWFSCRLFTKSG